MALSRTSLGLRTLAQAIALALVLPALAPAQGIRLNGQFPRPGSGDVDVMQISADGARAVYLATLYALNGNRDQELFSAPLDGSAAAIRLNAQLPTGSSVAQFLLSPARVVYLADQEVRGVNELFSAPIDGSAAPIKISGPFVSGGDVPFSTDPSFAITADGRYVVYLADQETDGDFQLYSVPIDGNGLPIRLARPGTRSQTFRISDDGRRVVYFAAFAGSLALASVPIDRSQAPVLLTGPLFSTPETLFLKHSFTFELTPDGQRVVYVSEDVPGELHLFSAPIDGSAAPVNLGGSFPDGIELSRYFRVTASGGRVVFLSGGGALRSAPVDGSSPAIQFNSGDPVDEFELSPDGLKVAYRIQHDQAASVLAVARVGQAGSARKIRGSESASLFQLSPDGSWIVFSIPQTGSSYGAVLYGAPVDASFGAHGSASGHLRSISAADPLRLGENLNPYVPGFQISADGKRVVFGASPLDPFVRELYSVPIDGHLPAVKIDPTLFPYGDVWSYAISPDGQRIVYRADKDTYHVTELFSAPIAGNASPLQLSSFAAGVVVGDVSGFELASDGAHALYWANEDSAAIELYSVALSAPGAPLKLNDPLPDGGSVYVLGSPQPLTPHLTPDGTRAVYVASRTAQQNSLFSVPLDRSQPPVELSPAPLIASHFRLMPAGDEVVFVGYDTAAGLWRAPVDGSAGPTLLKHLGAAQAIDEFALSADGSLVVYRSGGVLASVLTDASQSTVRLDPANGTVRDGFALSPDGSRVVFVVYRHGVSDAYDLDSARTDGSGAAVVLNGAPGAFYFPSSEPFRISPDGSRVVFPSRSTASGPLEIFAAPIDGSHAPLRLDDSPSVDDYNYRVSPDGGRVLYHALFQLYSVPIDHGASAVRLNPPFVGSGSVRDYVFLPDGLSVVYLAYDASMPFSLFRVPLDGSATAQRLTEPSIPAEPAFVSSADGDWLLYLSPRPSSGHYELYAVATDGSQTTKRINAPLVPNGSVGDRNGLGEGSFRISQDSTLVLYQADQETRGVTELFLSFL